MPLPDGWENVLEVCPVDQPRGFGDGFGAPRYVGGYHLHKGVDIVAPDGHADPGDVRRRGERRDTTSTAATAVYVQGKYGSTYNAHMTSIAKLGPVQAGDVIGYVGSTGARRAARRTTTTSSSDPNVMPSSWPASCYGYSIIEDAINPYPAARRGMRLGAALV